MSENQQAQVLLDKVKQERIDELELQLAKLNTKKYGFLINIVILVLAALWFKFNIDEAGVNSMFAYMLFFVVCAMNISYAESSRANKRVDLILKLIKAQ